MSYRPTMRVRPAGFISRLIAFLVDLVILSITMTLVLFAINEVITFFGLKLLFNRWISNSVNAETISSLIRILVVLLYYIFSVLYFATFYSLVGYTPGKYLVGLKVVRTDGFRLGFWRSVVRGISYYLSALLLFMGFIWIIFDKNRQALHDKIAGTVVIYRQ
jgi:uncharacterized RDD family membrane protein YckC